MPLRNFLTVVLPPTAEVVEQSALRRGDVVFHIAKLGSDGQLVPKTFAHVGLVADDIGAPESTTSVRVLHMGVRVELESWSSSRTQDDVSVMDTSGTMKGIDESIRSAIIDVALAMYQRTPSFLAQATPLCYYWMGNPLTASHPLFPSDREAYGFSCATFAHECYRRALPNDIGALVNIERMPLTTEDDMRFLRNRFGANVEAAPFARLYPGYMMGAFDLDQYPFEPEDWEPWKDHGRYIP